MLAERQNRTVYGKARTVLAELHAKCILASYKKLWSEVLRCVVYIYNCTLINSTSKDARGKTPHELITGKKPDFSNLSKFGTHVKVLKPKNNREGKLASKVCTRFMSATSTTEPTARMCQRSGESLYRGT